MDSSPLGIKDKFRLVKDFSSLRFTEYSPKPGTFNFRLFPVSEAMIPTIALPSIKSAL